MQTDGIVIDQTPREVPRAPFASESGLHRFVEANADLLGVKVVASARRGGGGLFKIDILAVDKAGRLFIIECKHDLIDASAVRQLRRYRAALINGWAALAPRLRSLHNQIPAEIPDPALVLIGYRFDDSVADQQLVRLVYRYHDVAFTDDEVQIQSSGRVSLHSVAAIHGPEHSHPRVSKKIASKERLLRSVPDLAESFWRVDADLQALKGVKVKYGGKNFVRYSTRAGIFAEAVIGDGVITWRTTVTRSMHSASDTPGVLALLRDASGRAG